MNKIFDSITNCCNGITESENTQSLRSIVLPAVKEICTILDAFDSILKQVPSQSHRVEAEVGKGFSSHMEILQLVWL